MGEGSLQTLKAGTSGPDSWLSELLAPAGYVGDRDSI